MCVQHSAPVAACWSPKTSRCGELRLLQPCRVLLIFLAARPCGPYSCQSGYTYMATRCYQNCPSGWYNDGLGMSCVINACNWGDEDNGAGLCRSLARHKTISCTGGTNGATRAFRIIQ